MYNALRRNYLKVFVDLGHGGAAVRTKRNFGSNPYFKD